MEGDALFVCREPACAETLFSSSRKRFIELVYVQTDSQIVALERCLHNSQISHGRPWGHRIRHLIIDCEQGNELSPIWEAEANGIIGRILAQALPLQSYSTGCRNNDLMPHTEGIRRALICPTSLIALSTCVQINSDGVFPVINSFENLEYLNLDFMGSYVSGSGWEHSIDHPLSLLKLKTLFWGFGNDDENLFVFSSRCVLGPGRHLTIDFEDIGRHERMDLIRPLFTRNTFTRLTISATDPLITMFASEIMAVPKVEFKSVPPPNILEVPSLPPYLSFEYSYTLSKGQLLEQEL
jgi:hypothetical protein